MDSTTTDVKEELMTIYDQIKFEGRQEGHQEEKKSIVLKAYDLHYSISEISELTLMSEKEITKILQENKRFDS